MMHASIYILLSTCLFRHKNIYTYTMILLLSSIHRTYASLCQTILYISDGFFSFQSSACLKMRRYQPHIFFLINVLRCWDDNDDDDDEQEMCNKFSYGRY